MKSHHLKISAPVKYSLPWAVGVLPYFLLFVSAKWVPYNVRKLITLYQDCRLNCNILSCGNGHKRAENALKNSWDFFHIFINFIVVCKKSILRELWNWLLWTIFGGPCNSDAFLLSQKYAKYRFAENPLLMKGRFCSVLNLEGRGCSIFFQMDPWHAPEVS